MAELPDFQVNDDDKNVEQLYYMMQMVMNGSVAPSNSLLAASLETLSYKNNALKYQQGAPGSDELLAKLMQLVPQGQDQQQPAPAQYQNLIDYAYTIQSTEIAYSLGCLRYRASAEKYFLSQTQKLRQSMFKKALAMDNNYVVKMLKELGQLSPEEEELALDIVEIIPDYLSPDIEFLNEVLLNDSQNKILAIHLPGFMLSFKFADDSVLECSFRFDIQNQLADVKTVAITGTAAELLAFVTKKRTKTVFSELIPLTEGEIKLYSVGGRGQVSQMLKKSLELAYYLKARLTMSL